MSDAPTTPDRRPPTTPDRRPPTTRDRRLPEDWTTARIATTGALAVVVGALVVGAALLSSGRGPHPDAGGRIERLYEEGDVAGMLRAFPEGTVAEGQEDAAELTLSRILAPGVGVVEVADPVDVAGVPVVRVRTGDGRDWCVRPDGGVLPGCRVGTIAVDASTEAEIDVVLTDVSLVLDSPTQFDLGLETRQAEQDVLRDLELRDASGTPVDGGIVQAANVIGQNVSPVDPAAPSLAPGSTLFLTWLIREDVAGRDLELVWDDGSLVLELSRVQWFVG